MSLTWPLSVPVLDDGVVTLRAHTPSDIDDMLAMARDPEMVRWTAVPSPYERVDAERFVSEAVARGWDDGGHRGWAIEATDSDGRQRFAGNLDIRGGAVADLGFALHPWARGRGLMTRAVRLACDWAFVHGGVEIIHWRAQVGNEASLRVAHAAGFTPHAVIPGLLNERGRVLDAWTASLRFGDSPVAARPWAGGEVIEGSRVRLRPLRHDDAPRIVEACSDPESRHWLSGLPHPYTETVAHEYVDDCVWQGASGAKATWAVADRATDALLGNVAVMDLLGIDPTGGEVGYWMHPAARSRGLMSEAMRLLVAHAFGPLVRRRLTLHAAAGNLASNAVARAAGFTAFGTQHAAERLGDGSHDDLIGYEMLASSLDP